MDLTQLSREINARENAKVALAFMRGVIAASGPLKNVTLRSTSIAIEDVSADPDYMNGNRSATETANKIIGIALEIENDKAIGGG